MFYSKFSMMIKIKFNNIINSSFVSPDLRPLRANKNGFYLTKFYFDIPGKLSPILKYFFYVFLLKKKLNSIYWKFLHFNYFIIWGILRDNAIRLYKFIIFASSVGCYVKFQYTGVQTFQPIILINRSGNCDKLIDHCLIP